MAETRTGDTASTTQAGQSSQRGLAPVGSSSVVVNQSNTTKGKTTIANGVVAKIVGIAAREIDGVKDVVGSEQEPQLLAWPHVSLVATLEPRA